MPTEPNHEYRHTAERLQELEAKVAELERWKQVHDEWHEKLEALLDDTIRPLQQRIEQLESDRDELFLAMERARIPRHF